MFKRRIPLAPIQKLREWLWPRRGWFRAGMYVMHRLSRLPGSGYSIACGFAFGAAISFTPFVGLHIVLASALAWLFGGNVLAALVGTMIGNPWTFPFIWLGLYKLGNVILIRNGEYSHPPPDFSDVFVSLWEATLSFDVNGFAHGISTVILPMTIASIPFFILAWVASYFSMKFLVDGFKRRRMFRLMRKRARAKKASRGGRVVSEPSPDSGQVP